MKHDPQSPAACSTLPAPRLLLVEDDLGFVTLLRTALTPAYTLDHVATLAEALVALAQRPYAGVLLDLNLPDSRHLTTLHRMLRATRGTPLVAVTGQPGLTTQGPGYVVLEKGTLDWADLPAQVQALLAQTGAP